MKKKIEYSKILATFSMLLFLCTLIYGYVVMTHLIMNESATIFDLTFFVSAITITGGVFMTTAKHYYSKSGLQNTTYIRNGVYEQILKVRLQFIEENLKLQKKYNVSQDEINEIEMESPFVEISESFLGGTTMKIDEVQSLNEAEPEGEIY